MAEYTKNNRLPAWSLIVIPLLLLPIVVLTGAGYPDTPSADHALMTEPLTTGQMESIGWSGREGVGDASNQFHYYRISEDNCILWGGYDATYHLNNGLDPSHDQSARTHGLLAQHFFETFPQLEGLRFTHRWGGAIGTTARFTATWGTATKDRGIHPHRTRIEGEEKPQ